MMRNNELFLGFEMSFLYEIIELFRKKCVHNRFWIAVEDLIFWIIATSRFFVLIYEKNDCVIRWVNVAGVILGIWVFHKLKSGVIKVHRNFHLRKRGD